MMDNRKELYLMDECYAVVGAAMAVHSALGCGMHEIVYGDALSIELGLRGIPFEREKSFSLAYKGIKLQHGFTCDFVCYDKVIVEIKAQKELTDMNRSQIINYLKFTDKKVGLLINFGELSLKRERFVV